MDEKMTNEMEARIRDLKVLWEKHGIYSPIGRHCDNLIKMLRNLPSYVRPAWATHESQTLQGKIRWQMDQLKAALQGR